MGDLILADFRSKTYHKPDTLEQMAAHMVEQFNEMAGPDEVVTVEYLAPPEDCA